MNNVGPLTLYVWFIQIYVTGLDIRKVPNIYLDFSFGVLPLTLHFSTWLIVMKIKEPSSA